MVTTFPSAKPGLYSAVSANATARSRGEAEFAWQFSLTFRLLGLSLHVGGNWLEEGGGHRDTLMVAAHVRCPTCDRSLKPGIVESPCTHCYASDVGYPTMMKISDSYIPCGPQSMALEKFLEDCLIVQGRDPLEAALLAGEGIGGVDGYISALQTLAEGRNVAAFETGAKIVLQDLIARG